MSLEKLNSIKEDFQAGLDKASDMESIEKLRVSFLGKKGLLTQQIKSLGSLPQEERKKFGQQINELKNFIESAISSSKSKVELDEMNRRLESEKIDITLPGRKYARGKTHPISHVIEEIKEIFASMGFDHATGPEIEDDWHNFTALNIPESHPARQMHDTFYTKDEDDMLLRTHTSNVQIRHMQQNKPPYRIISVGRVFRSDYDATHTPMFHQVEALCIDKNITMAHLKGCLETFLKMFFGLDELPIRLRPSYFPFTEPSAEVDVQCDRSSKDELKIGKGEDWLEILGCGMVHPNVLKNVNVDPDEYQGFAFGAGVERLAMLKYNIPDLRTFFESDLRWLKHYGF